MTILPSEAGPANVYKLMVGAIVPRPIAFVSTISLAGVRNLAPFSFFTACSANPPVVLLCAYGARERRKRKIRCTTSGKQGNLW